MERGSGQVHLLSQRPAATIVHLAISLLRAMASAAVPPAPSPASPASPLFGAPPLGRLEEFDPTVAYRSLNPLFYALVLSIFPNTDGQAAAHRLLAWVLFAVLPPRWPTRAPRSSALRSDTGAAAPAPAEAGPATEKTSRSTSKAVTGLMNARALEERMYALGVTAEVVTLAAGIAALRDIQLVYIGYSRHTREEETGLTAFSWARYVLRYWLGEETVPPRMPALSRDNMQPPIDVRARYDPDTARALLADLDGRRDEMLYTMRCEITTQLMTAMTTLVTTVTALLGRDLTEEEDMDLNGFVDWEGFSPGPPLQASDVLPASKQDDDIDENENENEGASEGTALM